MSRGAAKRRRLIAALKAKEEERQRVRNLNPVSFDLNEDLKDAYFFERTNFEKSFRLLLSVAIRVSELHDEEFSDDNKTGPISGQSISPTG